MIKTLFRLSLMTVLSIHLVAAAAHAEIYSFEQSITEDGQQFIFALNDIAPSDGTDGTLVIEALGDYSPTPPSSEIMDIDIDSIFSDFAFDPSRGGTVGTDLFQNAAMQSYSIPGADMQAITDDGAFIITLQNANSVDFFVDQPEDFVRATLRYSSVPEPTTAALLIAAIVGGLRFRNDRG